MNKKSLIGHKRSKKESNEFTIKMFHKNNMVGEFKVSEEEFPNFDYVFRHLKRELKNSKYDSPPIGNIQFKEKDTNSITKTFEYGKVYTVKLLDQTYEEEEVEGEEDLEDISNFFILKLFLGDFEYKPKGKKKIYPNQDKLNKINIFEKKFKSEIQPTFGKSNFSEK